MAVDIPELGDDRHRLWCDLIDLAQAFPAQWTIIGAHMVAQWRTFDTDDPERAALVYRRLLFASRSA